MKTLSALLVTLVITVAGCTQPTEDADTVVASRGCDVRPEVVAAPAEPSPIASVARVTFEQQLRGAAVVLVGTVRSSTVAPATGTGAVAIPLRTTTFAVDCLLRGDDDARKDVVAVTELFGEDHAEGLTVGGTYLVFAEHRTLLGRYRRLVPMGAAQGIYPVDARGQATNAANGSHALEQVVRQVAAP